MTKEVRYNASHGEELERNTIRKQFGKLRES